MEKTLLEVIKDRRLALGNPYAYIDELSDFQAALASKKLLGNPHAYTEEIERMTTAVSRFDGIAIATAPISKPSQPAPLKKHSDQEIEQLVRKLQIRIWREFKANGIDNPFRALDPLFALQTIGYRTEVVDSLGTYGAGAQAIEVAGLINSKEKVVRVSTGQKSPYVQSFTTAHELGHALMHEGMDLHRDRPLDGTQNLPREQHEYEADKFATFFLMPRKLVTQLFEEIYGRAPFKLTDETMFALSSASQSRKEKRFSSLRDLSIHLSSIGAYNRVQFVPLHHRFKVSKKTMAIRLEELGLIQFN